MENEKTICTVANYEHLGKICWGNETMRKLFHTEEARLERYPGVKYGWDNEAYSYDNIAEEDPELLAYMQELAAKYPDRIKVGAVSYGQPLSFYINGESNVRQLTEGVRACEKYFGQRPYVYNMSEHGMHAQIPQLIAQAGFTGAVMRTSFCMYGVNPEYPYSCIRWFGPDGSMGVPTVPTYPGEQCHCAVNGYSHDKRTLEFAFFGANTMDNKILLDYPVDAPWGGLEEFVDRFSGRIKNVIAYRADDPRQPEGIVAEYSSKPGYKWVLDTDIIEAAGEPEADIATAVNDFQVRMPWGLCGNWIWEKCRSYESALYNLDALAALRVLSGGEGQDADLEEAWKTLLICQHHDVQICGLETDARKCFARGDAALERLGVALCGEEYTLNTLPWMREDCNEEAAFSCCKVRDNSEDCSCGALDTRFYSISVAECGGFDSIYDKQHGRELFMPGRRSGYLAGTINGVPCVAVGRMRAAAHPDRMVITDTGKIGEIPYTVTWTFYESTPRIDVKIDVDLNREFIGRRSTDPEDTVSSFVHDEKLRLKVYPNLSEKAMGWRDSPYAVAATNRQSLECGMWGALVEGDNGLAVFNHGVACIARELDGAISMPVAFSMYYRWGRTLTKEFYRDEIILKSDKRYYNPDNELLSRLFLQGTYTTNFALYPFRGDWKSAQLQRRALEYTYPTVKVPAAVAEWVESTGFAVEADENVFVSALYTRDGKAYIRLYELYGKEGCCKVKLNGEYAKLTPVDFFENDTGKAVTTAMLGHNAVRTFRIERD